VWFESLTTGSRLSAKRIEPPYRDDYLASFTRTSGAASATMSPVLERPKRRRVLTFVALAGIAAPAFTGVLDLALRARTP